MSPNSRPRLSDVAQRAHVSAATVSRALSAPHRVKAETRERICAVVAELGYVRDGTGRALVSRRTHTVGVIVPTLSHSIFAVAIQAMQTALAEAGYQLFVAAHEYNPMIEASALRSLLERGVDAVLLVGTDHGRDVWQMIETATVPVVLTWSLHDRVPSIGFDNERAGRLAAEHLLALGHRRFGFISGPLRNNDRSGSRLAGVRAALAEAGVDLPSACVTEHPFGLSGGRTGMRALMALAERPTAIIGGNDLMAIGAMIEMADRGLSVPADASVVGIDDLEFAEHISPGLTTVHLPTRHLGALAAELALRRLTGEGGMSRIELPIELVVRGSTAPAPSRERHRNRR